MYVRNKAVLHVKCIVLFRSEVSCWFQHRDFTRLQDFAVHVLLPTALWVNVAVPGQGAEVQSCDACQNRNHFLVNTEVHLYFDIDKGYSWQ